MIDLQNANTIVDFELFNVAGSLVDQGKFKKRRNEIDLSKQPNGIYLIKLIKGKTLIKTLKLLKQ